jgi:Spy/CpxP family protein refolding chaperone
MRVALFLLSLISLTFAFSPALAADQDSNDKKDPVLIYREAGASDEQEAKIRQYAQEYEKAARVRVERLHNLNKQMTELSYEAELDEKKITALQDEINELQSSISSERIKLMLRIRSLLSSEQKSKLVELMKAREATRNSASTAGVHQ